MKSNQQMILDAHVIRPGHPGLECLAGVEVDNVALDVFDGLVICPSCGCELGRADQLMIQVWDEEPVYPAPGAPPLRRGTTAQLAFVG